MLSDPGPGLYGRIMTGTSLQGTLCSVRAVPMFRSVLEANIGKGRRQTRGPGLWRSDRPAVLSPATGAKTQTGRCEPARQVRVDQRLLQNDLNAAVQLLADVRTGRHGQIIEAAAGNRD